MADDIKRLLLVEDNPGDARLIQTILLNNSPTPVEIQHVFRLEEAVAILQQNQDFYAILLDLSLPDSSGVETVQGIFNAAPRIPIVILTGLEDDMTANQAFIIGAQDYLIKGQTDAQLLWRSIRYAAERKDFERVLRESELRYRLLADNATDVIAVFDIEKRRLTYVSPSISRLMGYSVTEALAIPIEQILTPQPDALAKHDLVAESEIIRAPENDAYSPLLYNRGLVHKEGHIVPIEVTVSYIKDETGKVVSVLASARDITERIRAKNALSQSQEQFSKIFKISPVPIAITRLRDRMILDVNDTFITYTGYEREEVIGHTAVELKIWINLEKRERLLADIVASGVIREIESPYRTKSGEIRLALLSIVALDISGEKCFITMFYDITERKEAEHALHDAREQLAQRVQELELVTQELALLTDMVTMLQICKDRAEAFGIIQKFSSLLFPDLDGALFMIDESKKFLNPEMTWGQAPFTREAYPIEGCLAIKHAKPGRFIYAQNDAICNHILPEQIPSSHLCLPIRVQGQIIGLFYVGSRQGQGCITPHQEYLITATVEQIDLAISNLDLRHHLREQAIHDPLTGLFNRLYMEETLKRELHREERAQNTLCILMMDIDHFKKFNDSYGHQAGDALLRELGTLLRQIVRASDVACRYGGEEFLLILPGTTAQAGLARAEQLRQRVKNITITYEGRTLGNITVSIGVSAWPENGREAEIVIDAADDAMYQAKQMGRDRCVLAPSSRQPDKGEIT